MPLAQRNVHVTVSISPKQYEWVRKRGLQFSSVLQSAINRLVKEEAERDLTDQEVARLLDERRAREALTDATQSP